MRPELRKSTELPFGWDGCYADPVPEETAERADKLLDLLEGKPSIVPCADGSILLEFADEQMEILVAVEGGTQIWMEPKKHEPPEPFGQSDHGGSLRDVESIDEVRRIAREAWARDKRRRNAGWT